MRVRHSTKLTTIQHQSFPFHFQGKSPGQKLVTSCYLVFNRLAVTGYSGTPPPTPYFCLTFRMLLNERWSLTGGPFYMAIWGEGIWKKHWLCQTCFKPVVHGNWSDNHCNQSDTWLSILLLASILQTHTNTYTHPSLSFILLCFCFVFLRTGETK